VSAGRGRARRPAVEAEGPGAAVLQPRAVRALGLDVGSVTIGVARGDLEVGLATAVETLARVGTVGDVAAIVERVRAGDHRTVVVGWPLELDGRVGHRAKRVQVLIDALRGGLDAAGLERVPVVAWDERFSTAAAERTLLALDTSRARRKATVDAHAAQFILQGWIDAERNRAAAAASQASERAHGRGQR